MAEFRCFNQRILGKTIQFPLIKHFLFGGFKYFCNFAPYFKIVRLVHGREKDIAILEQLYASKRPEFVVVYGHRRVGKTYLVSELFKSRFAFYHTGLSPLNHNKEKLLSDQLSAFYITLREYGLDSDMPHPQNWLDAFELLKTLLIRKKTVSGKWCSLTRCRG